MKIEIRSANEAVIEGYVNAVARDSRVLPSSKGVFVEQVVPGTFKKALSKSKNVEVRVNHEKIVGSTQEKNLILYEDNIGLYARAFINDEETIKKAARKELRGWSFAFVKVKDRWEVCENNIQRRYLEDIELREVSILDKTPAYIATSIEMRGDDAVVCEERNFDEEIEVINDIKEEKREENNIVYDYYIKQIEILKMGGK